VATHRHRLDHLLRLTDDTGVLEHARGTVPRRDHGYCTDDNARALIVACRVGDDWRAQQLAEVTLAFLQHAHLGNGRFLNRLGYDRRWDTADVSDDASGRAIWALGEAAANAPWPWIRRDAHALFHDVGGFTSPHRRSVAYAALGAATELPACPGCSVATGLLLRARDVLDGPGRGPSWPWPEARLTYANALIPDGLIRAGQVLGDDDAVRHGLHLLAWLVAHQTVDDRLTFVPSSGCGPDDVLPGYDQQPIEPATLAEAAAFAAHVTGDPRWHSVVLAAAAWFAGDNDLGLTMVDRETGGALDGLTATGVNRNQGAESTISALLTANLARRSHGAGALTVRSR
jgi:hypothetical protein